MLCCHCSRYPNSALPGLVSGASRPARASSKTWVGKKSDKSRRCQPLVLIPRLGQPSLHKTSQRERCRLAATESTRDSTDAAAVILHTSLLLLLWLWIVLPDNASAEGLIPVGLFQSWLTEIESVGPWGPVIFTLSVAAGEMVPLLPTQPLALAGGLLFGAVRGTIYVLIGTTTAAVLAFNFSRGIGKQLASKVIQQELGEDPAASESTPADILSRFKGLQEAVEQGNAWQQFTAMVFLRLTPVVPFSASNYLLGLTPVQIIPFTAGTLSGMAAWCSLYATLGGAGRSLLKKGTSLDTLLSDLTSQAEVYAEEAGVALALIAAGAAAVWWLRRQPDSSSTPDL